VYVWGLRVPSQFAWVPALALTHLCVPEASFPAHLCGVLAGVVRAYLVEPGEGGGRVGGGQMAR
jgi:hypothetical protein